MNHKKPDVELPPFTAETFQLGAKGQTVDYWHSLIKSIEGHELSQGENAVIYIVDTASAFLHPDLSDEGNQYGYDPYNEGISDGHGHGHLCAGVAAAIDNAVGVIGVAPKSIAIPIKGLNKNGQGWDDKIADGFRRCRETHAQNFPDKIGIISGSFGGGSPMPKLEKELQRCKQAGMVTIVAAGNAGNSDGEDTVNHPGKYDDLCITVAAIGPDNKPAWFSSAGEAVDITAYGVNILTTNNKNGYSRAYGTSFSTPMVAGLAACIASYHLEEFKSAGSGALSLMESYLKEFAVDMLEPGEDDRTGAGRPELPTYLENTPDDTPPDDDEPGDDPNPPDDGPRTREKRSLTIMIPGQFWLKWATMGSRRATMDARRAGDILAESEDYLLLQVTSLQGYKWQDFYVDHLIIGLNTQFYDDYITTHLQNFVERHFPSGQRGYLMRSGKDVQDAGQAAMHFLQMFARGEGWDIEFSSVEARRTKNGPGYYCLKMKD